MSCIFTITDFTDGETIAAVFSDFYLNRGSRYGTALFDCMIKQPRNVVYNFTVLCIEWFLALSKVSYYDDRNKASVMIARKMADSQKFSGLTYRVYKKIPSGYFRGDGTDHRDIALMFSLFMRVNREDRYGKTPQDDFLEKMLQEHKTIQQNFSRLCFAWFDYLSEHSEEARGAHIRLAKLAAAYREPLPYI